ncbi:MAG: radical SAM protein [Gemmatimonadetes bacterium]|nr:radical SAM protein [Gemmatimonadota bacterium]
MLGVGGLVQLGARSPLDRGHLESVGATVLRRRAGATRGWLKVQDGCDRKCAFCATRLARGRSRSRHPDEVVAEARVLARTHPELVITGVHIGHYGRDLAPRTTLTALVRRLLDEVAGTSPAPRFRLGSIEATEIDDGMLGLLAESGGRLAPHLHMPLQSGADPVLRNMRRWHTREQYRRRALEIAARISPLGLGADIITGFPGESPADHADTIALVRELPFTYLHVFPYSPRDGTAAMRLDGRVPERVSRERGRELRDLAAEKAARYTRGRGRAEVEVVMEGRGGTALTGDYLRVEVGAARPPDPSVLHRGRLSGEGSRVVLDTPGPRRVN